MTNKTHKTGNYRWRILAMLFVATTINYMDRTIIGVLAPTLQYKIFNWSDADYASISIAFKIAYALGMLTMGGIIDRFGTRIGYTISIAIWSVFGMLHAVIRPAFGFIGFVIARFGLGFGESGNFPAAVKTVAEWFPKKERAFANGIFNAGTNIGAIMAPLIIPLVVVASTGKNWQFAFLTTGLFSAIWVIVWLSIYHKPENHPKISNQELAYINSDSRKESPEKVPWLKLLPIRQTWAFPIVKITDAVWWFYLFWAGKFLFDMFGLNIQSIALPLIVIYLVADGGSITGGWFSSYLIRKGWSINKARKFTLLMCALIIMPVMFVTKIRTGFEVTPERIELLSATKIKIEGELVPVPMNVIEDVKKFEGRGFKAARNFEDTLAAVYGKTVSRDYIMLITEASLTDKGTFMVSDKTIITAESQGIPDELLSSLKRINSRKPEKKEKETIAGFQSFIEKETGKITISTYESAIFNSMRTNKLYWIAVLLIALAAGGHQAWAANIFTLVSDVFPKKATASVIGIGGMIGAIAGIAADRIMGTLLSTSGPSGYFFAFLGAGLIYLVTLGIVHLLMPNMNPLGDDLKPLK
jgi:ACS family hexuronate transporter-like MFS transporter